MKDFIFSNYRSTDDYLHIAKLNGNYQSINLNDLTEMIEKPKSVEGKCCLLIRVSSEHQDLEQQTEKVKEAAINDGFKDEDIIVIEDKESAVKLSEEERLGLNKLKRYIATENITCVYVYEVSRISRRPEILYSIRNYLFEHHIQLIVLNPYMKMLKDDGTMSETANIFFGIFSSMAENEGFIRKARMRRGAEKKKSRGLYAGGAVAIGYKIEDEHLIIDEPNATMVKRIFNEYAAGKSVRQLARELQAEGWRSNTAYLTACQSILNILHREYYCGDKWHPQIISRDLFNRCRDIAHNKTVYKKNINEALLKGIIYDMKTGYLMSSNMANGQYYCKRYGNTTISMKAADTLIGGLANEWYNIISSYKIEELRMSIRNDIARYERIAQQQEKNITENQDRIDRVTEMYIDGKFSKERAEAKQKQIFENLQQYQRTLKDAQDNIMRLTEELKNSTPKIFTLRDKILYVVDSIYVSRISRFVCEIKVMNKWTGEQRTYEYDTRKLIIHKMSIKLRDTLSY